MVLRLSSVTQRLRGKRAEQEEAWPQQASCSRKPLLTSARSSLTPPRDTGSARGQGEGKLPYPPPTGGGPTLRTTSLPQVAEAGAQQLQANHADENNTTNTLNVKLLLGPQFTEVG